MIIITQFYSISVPNPQHILLLTTDVCRLFSHQAILQFLQSPTGPPKIIFNPDTLYLEIIETPRLWALAPKTTPTSDANSKSRWSPVLLTDRVRIRGSPHLLFGFDHFLQQLTQLWKIVYLLH